jgi:hypothetical protein
LLRWLTQGSGSGRRGRRPRPAGRRPFVPRLDVLEDRTVLTTFPVTTLADGGPGSLRQAIFLANATPGDDTITFAVTGTINLASALPDLSSNIDIQGPGASTPWLNRSSTIVIVLRYFPKPPLITNTAGGVCPAREGCQGHDYRTPTGRPSDQDTCPHVLPSPRAARPHDLAGFRRLGPPGPRGLPGLPTACGRHLAGALGRGRATPDAHRGLREGRGLAPGYHRPGAGRAAAGLSRPMHRRANRPDSGRGLRTAGAEWPSRHARDTPRTGRRSQATRPRGIDQPPAGGAFVKRRPPCSRSAAVRGCRRSRRTRKRSSGRGRPSAPAPSKPRGWGRRQAAPRSVSLR